MKFLAVFSLILASAYGGALKSGRIIKGELAEEGQFPSQVGLSIQKEAGSFWCGGSLISPEWILTAAHCVNKVYGGTAYLGMIESGHELHSIPFTPSDIIVHEGYKFPKDDIALIHIKPVELSRTVSTIELANGSMVYDNSRAIAVGWGKTSDNSFVVPNLYYATLIVERLSECKSTFGELPESNICVITTSGSSTCQGDSGGPLISRLDRKLIGVTSFGSAAGCEKGLPVAFTRVSYYLDWINKNTGLHFQ